MRQGTLQRGRREDRGIWVYIFPDPTCKDFEYLCAFIFVDEIDTILSLSFPVNDFFGFIRYCHELRQNHATYQRLTWALFSVATPSDLIRDRTYLFPSITDPRLLEEVGDLAQSIPTKFFTLNNGSKNIFDKVHRGDLPSVLAVAPNPVLLNDEPFEYLEKSALNSITLDKRLALTVYPVPT